MSDINVFKFSDLPEEDPGSKLPDISYLMFEKLIWDRPASTLPEDLKKYSYSENGVVSESYPKRRR